MYKYIGDGSINLGVPNRDLTDDEWAALTEKQRAIAVKCQQFEKVEEQPAESVAEEEE